MYIVPKEKHNIAINGVVLGDATQEQLKQLAANNHPYVTKVGDKPVSDKPIADKPIVVTKSTKPTKAAKKD